MLGLELGVQALPVQSTSRQFLLHILCNQVFAVSCCLVESLHYQDRRLVALILGFESFPELAIALVGQQILLPIAVEKRSRFPLQSLDDVTVIDTATPSFPPLLDPHPG